jgi:hypothetical protein
MDQIVTLEAAVQALQRQLEAERAGHVADLLRLGRNWKAHRDQSLFLLAVLCLQCRRNEMLQSLSCKLFETHPLNLLLRMCLKDPLAGAAHHTELRR